MLNLNQISKTYGTQPILRNITFSVNPGGRLGLIGPNGCGKSTLMRARLTLAVLAAAGVNFLLLDEPNNHFDIPSRDRFEKALEIYSGTALIISHDRYFIKRFATDI